MTNKIAVIVNSESELTNFEEGSSILLFSKLNDDWQVEHIISYSLDPLSSISDTRDCIKIVISQLKNCKIIIAKAMSGIPYIIFDRMGFAIFEATDISNTILDEILSDVEEYSNIKHLATMEPPTSPVETEIPGVYFFNLVELQQKRPEISSKKALKAFIENGKFIRLEIICNHLPPWLESYFSPDRLSYIMEPIDMNSCKVSISKVGG
ncbi:Fe-only nitrogenase accessory protein AnfO [Ruminiclostridium herbifermentans]|uniref:Fe-only nitrogenase accessory protein AnfO n=1 Tax=Ruminiclostridium herbifermentans TaxID=2488810 RepID=A0A4U7JJ14_9FIRM|nr:Fe-only nitrogenase accessory AnfO family protein [Ruminiclostridium herbifermentans]QNU67207.1 Fe-only nitrogenase accessory protein AnfO [Ruminiclostridium herbifermentans]